MSIHIKIYLHHGSIVGSGLILIIQFIDVSHISVQKIKQKATLKENGREGGNVKQRGRIRMQS